MRLQSAIFDMDGTLLDSMHMWRGMYAQVVRDMGKEPQPDFVEQVKPLTLRQAAAYCKEAHDLPLTVEEVIQRFENRINTFYRTEVQAKPGLKEFLSLLKMEGVWMYVATATDRPLAEAALRHAGIDGYFRGMVTVAEAGVGGAVAGWATVGNTHTPPHTPTPSQARARQDLWGPREPCPAAWKPSA